MYITLESVSKRFSKARALDNVSLEIAPQREGIFLRRSNAVVLVATEHPSDFRTPNGL
jgi:hypothetical protein